MCCRLSPCRSQSRGSAPASKVRSWGYSQISALACAIVFIGATTDFADTRMVRLKNREGNADLVMALPCSNPRLHPYDQITAGRFIEYEGKLKKHVEVGVQGIRR